LVILPGAGYTTEHPVLYYLRRAALTQHYDVLSVQYGFQAGRRDFESQDLLHLRADFRGALEPVLARGYRHICIAGKSLGTPLAAEFARSLTADSLSLLLLTPIQGALEESSRVRTLVVIGTADSRYSASEVAAFANHPTITWKVIEGLDHSLEVEGDWNASLAVLPQIIALCADFLTAAPSAPKVCFF
jgi:surfactin synthase thioesterase subunit